MRTTCTAAVVAAAVLMPLAALAQDAADAIRGQAGAFAEALNAGDAARIAEFYTEDATAFPPDQEPVQGREAIAGFWQGVMESGVADVALTPTEVEVRDDLAFEVGEFDLTAPGADGARMPVSGKYVVVWRQGEDDAWRMHRDIWNYDPPPGDATAQTE